MILEHQGHQAVGRLHAIVKERPAAGSGIKNLSREAKAGVTFSHGTLEIGEWKTATSRGNCRKMKALLGVSEC